MAGFHFFVGSLGPLMDHRSNGDFERVTIILDDNCCWVCSADLIRIHQWAFFSTRGALVDIQAERVSKGVRFSFRHCYCCRLNCSRQDAAFGWMLAEVRSYWSFRPLVSMTLNPKFVSKKKTREKVLRIYDCIRDVNVKIIGQIIVKMDYTISPYNKLSVTKG